MTSSFQVYNTVYLAQVKHFIRHNKGWLLLILGFFPYQINKLTVTFMNLGLSSTTIAACWGIIGIFMGIGLFIANLQLTEIRFLWSLGKRTSFLTKFMLCKQSPFILLFAWMLLGQLLCNNQAVQYVWKSLFMWVLGFSYAELSIYFCLAIAGKVVQQPFRFLAQGLLCLLLLFMNGIVVTMSVTPMTWMMSVTILSMGQFIGAFWVARYAWPQLLCTVSLTPIRGRTRSGGLARYPLLRKELFFSTRFQCILYFLCSALLVELFTFYTVAVSPEVISSVTVILVWLVGAIWMTRGFANEGKGLTLYAVTRGAWRKMLAAKWFFYWALTTGIIAIHTVVWRSGSSPLWMVLLSTLVSLHLLLGYRFTKGGRISFVHELLITTLASILLYVYYTYVIWFILISIVIQGCYFRLYRSIPANFATKL